jgi:hypothetical protein
MVKPGVTAGGGWVLPKFTLVNPEPSPLKLPLNVPLKLFPLLLKTFVPEKSWLVERSATFAES